MYLIFLILSLGVLLFVEYYFLFKNEIATPAISFTLGLFICAIILSTFIDLWDVHLHQETYWLIIGGSICVALGSLGGDILSKKKKEENRGGAVYPNLSEKVEIHIVYSNFCSSYTGVIPV